MTQPTMRAQEDVEGMIEKHQNTVYRIAYAYMRNKADANDIFQDVFLRYFEKCPVFHDENHEKAWFIRVTINRCKKVLTSVWFKRTTGLPDELPEPIKDDSGKADLFNAVMRLPSKYRVVIHLYYYEDYPVKQIASILDRKETTIQSQLMRARAMLRESLKE